MKIFLLLLALCCVAGCQNKGCGCCDKCTGLVCQNGNCQPCLCGCEKCTCPGGKSWKK